ncbi:IS481 family transposase, partial [Dyella jejuensis]
VSTVRRWLASQGMNRLPPLQPPMPIRRYEHDAPGDLLHLDIKKLGRIVRPGHRVTGDPRDNTDGAGWECIHVAIDDHSRVGFSKGYRDETADSASAFLRAAVAYYACLGVTIRRLLTDNGAAYRSRSFAAVCVELRIKHRFTRPYTPRTNGKAERFIQTALREWAYARTYQNSAERQAALQPWMHRYNHHRPHSALGYQPPISRLARNNVSNFN